MTGVSSAATEDADADAAEHGCRTKLCLSKSFNASISQAHTISHVLLFNDLIKNY